MRLHRQAILAIAASTALTACATTEDGDYPSLAKRDAERLTGRLLPAGSTGAGLEERPAAAPAPASLLGQIDSLVAQARAAHGRFEAQLGTARRSVNAARGAARASDAWINAQVALSSLQSARSGTMSALADLDLLAAQELLAEGEDYAASVNAAQQARDDVAALVEEEDRAVGSLWSSLR